MKVKNKLEKKKEKKEEQKMKTRKLFFIILALLICFGGCKEFSDGESTEEKIKEEIYSIEYFPSEGTPQIAVIVALKVIRSSGGMYGIYSSGHCFREAFKELSGKYEIGEITEVQAELYNASITSELIIHIKPLE